MIKKKYLITGGAGMIGSNIVKKLCLRGHDVTVLDNLSAYPFDYLNEFGVGKNKDVNFINGSVLNKNLVNTLVKNSDIVIHAAAYADVGACVRNYDVDFENNVVGTFNVLDAAKKQEIEKIIFVSSASVYGSGNSKIFRENQALAPISTYGASKLWGETEAKLFYSLYNVPTVSLRYFSVYGSPQTPKEGSHSWCVAIFAMLAKKNKPITINGKGDQIRDFVHVSDIAEATILASEKESAIGHTINIGTGKPTTINAIAKNIFKYFDEVPMLYKPLPSGDPMGGYADITLMKKLLNWEPETSLDEGIKEYCHWLENHQHLIPTWL